MDTNNKVLSWKPKKLKADREYTLGIEAIRDNTDEIVADLYQKLTNHFNTFPLKVAGRFIYFDMLNRCFVLACHTTGADKTKEVAEVAWDGLPSSLKEELASNKIGFAGKQI
jgi:hypothetical protein